MTKKDFLELDINSKIKALYTEGCFVVSIRYYHYKINLYLLNNFYVEVFYNHKHDQIEKILPMERNHTRNKFYADQIHLPVELFL